MRHDDSPDLFGKGIGVSTLGTFTCEWCGHVYNPEADKTERYEDENAIRWTTFGGKQIGDCCFYRIENAVLHRMDNVLPWFRKILDSQQQKLNIYDDGLKKLGH